MSRQQTYGNLTARSGPARLDIVAHAWTTPTTVAIVPHTHWDREWYSPFQTFRLRLVKLLDDAAADARDATCRTRGSCSTARPPCSTTTSRSDPSAAAPATPRGRRPALDRAVDGPDGRVHGVGRDDRARPADGHRARLRVRRRDAGRLPPRHVRPRRGDAADPAARGHRARGRVARRSGRGRPDRVLVGGARRLARCAPSTSTARTRTGATCREDAKGSCCAPPTTNRSSARRDSAACCLMNGTDHQMPQPWLGRVVAEANAIQDDYEFVVTSLPEYLPHATERRARRPSTASCARARAPTCSWASRRTASTCTRRARRRSVSLERRAEPLSALFLPADAVPARAGRHRVAQPRAQQRARLVVRVQSRRGRRPGARPLLRSAPDRRRARRATRCTRSRATVDAPPARPSW